MEPVVVKGAWVGRRRVWVIRRRLCLLGGVGIVGVSLRRVSG
jgi:hypothetical protein